MSHLGQLSPRPRRSQPQPRYPRCVELVLAGALLAVAPSVAGCRPAQPPVQNALQPGQLPPGTPPGTLPPGQPPGQPTAEPDPQLAGGMPAPYQSGER